MGLLDSFMENARKPGGLLSDEGMYQMAGMLSQVPTLRGRQSPVAALGNSMLAQAGQLRKERQQQERAAQVQSLLGAPDQELQGPGLPGQGPLMGEGSGYLGGDLTPQQFYAQMLTIPDYEQIGAAGLMQLQKAQAGGGHNFGLTPFLVQGPDGKLQAYQLSSGGGMTPLPIPEGARIPEGIRTIDTGQQHLVLGNRTGTVQGQHGKTPDPDTIYSQDQQNARLAQQPQIAALTDQAKAGAQAQQELPEALASAQQTLDLLDKAIKHPGRAAATGGSGIWDPRNYIAGTDARNYQVLAEQLKGHAFLEAFQKLKGGGAITEKEIEAATNAQARLNSAQSDDEYLSALMEMRDSVMRRVERTKQKASGAGADDPLGIRQ